MADPIKTAINLKNETLFNLGCRNAKGLGSSAQAVVDAIYEDFTDRNVQRVKPSTGNLDGLKMTYWGNPLLESFDTLALLSNADGKCGAWARFFTDVLRSQGIDAEVTSLKAPFPTSQLQAAIQTEYPNWSGRYLLNSLNQPVAYPAILVKNWQITGKPFAPIDLNGVAAQGDQANPQAYFTDHAVVEYGNKLYDPSYGQNTFENRTAWEDASLNAFGLILGVTPPCSAPLEVGQVPVLFRRLVGGMGCIG
jgi:hypothetical protein